MAKVKQILQCVVCKGTYEKCDKLRKCECECYNARYIYNWPMAIEFDQCETRNRTATITVDVEFLAELPLHTIENAIRNVLAKMPAITAIELSNNIME